MRRVKWEEMSECARRIYLRRQRRERVQRFRRILMVLALLLVCSGIFSWYAVSSKAESSENLAYKYYTNVTIQYGETVWELADQYIDYDHYEDKADYLDEVCSINRISSCDHIGAGDRIVFPYYSEEYK